MLIPAHAVCQGERPVFSQRLDAGPAALQPRRTLLGLRRFPKAREAFAGPAVDPITVAGCRLAAWDAGRNAGNFFNF